MELSRQAALKRLAEDALNAWLIASQYRNVEAVIEAAAQDYRLGPPVDGEV